MTSSVIPVILAHPNGPGCNHLKYEFMEKILKIRDFVGLNLQSIFSYQEKNILLKIRRFRDKKSKWLKNVFFQFLAVFGPQKGGFGPNFGKKYFFRDN